MPTLSALFAPQETDAPSLLSAEQEQTHEEGFLGEWVSEVGKIFLLQAYGLSLASPLCLQD